MEGGAYVHSDTPYIDQSPEALRLTLVEGNLDRTPFHLLSEKDCELGGVNISAAVIGASHIVSYTTEAFTLHEIFACVGLETLPYWPLAELKEMTVVRKFPGFSYEFRAESVDWVDPQPSTIDSMERTAARLAAKGSVGLVVDFPRGESLVTPKTIVLGDISKDGRGVTFTTAHSYPNVRGLVISRSTLQYT